MTAQDAARASVERCLRLGAGFRADERAQVVARLARLEERLKSFRAEEVDLEISVKERGRPTQAVTLECRMARRPTVVGTGEGPDLDTAVADARDEVVRQVTDMLGRREPKASRRLRRTIRGTGGPPAA